MSTPTTFSIPRPFLVCGLDPSNRSGSKGGGRDRAETRAHARGSFRSPTPRARPVHGPGATTLCHTRPRQGSFGTFRRVRSAAAARVRSCDSRRVLARCSPIGSASRRVRAVTSGSFVPLAAAASVRVASSAATWTGRGKAGHQRLACGMMRLTCTIRGRAGLGTGMARTAAIAVADSAPGRPYRNAGSSASASRACSAAVTWSGAPPGPAAREPSSSPAASSAPAPSRSPSAARSAATAPAAASR